MKAAGTLGRRTTEQFRHASATDAANAFGLVEVTGWIVTTAVEVLALAAVLVIDHHVGE